PIFQEPLEDIGDPLFWTPLFAVFHSLREEEALQLLTEDIREVDGIMVFDLCKGPGKQFKTEDSIRRIPVHKSLIALGLPELVRLRRQQGESRLFPHLIRNSTRNTFSASFTKIFGRYREKVKIYDPKRDFHALRTTFNVELIRNRVDAEIRKVLMGHRILDVNYVHYSGEGYSLEHLRDVVNMIDIDIGMIRKPFAEPPAVAGLTAARRAFSVVS
ncbi:MAG: tyrosine-type recombinase/integrase, partial [Paracoccus sp. (in: a-proteobacteria)]|nr:tyrosine-type recombinase/integrase [Paracoccus sp. (in: a-proteobacteria)]